MNPSFPRGIVASIGPGANVPPELAADKGVVTIAVADDWFNVERTKGVYDFSGLDTRISNAKAAGFKSIIIAVTDSPFKAPAWVLDACEAIGETFVIPDVGEDHNTHCQDFRIPLWWSAPWQSARLALKAAMGARYDRDKAISAVFISGLNVHSMDWDNPDAIGFFCEQNVNMVQQWLDHGWTRDKAVQAVKENADATAAAFPSKILKLPIGGMDKTLAETGSPDPNGTNGKGNYSTAAREVDAYITSRKYRDRYCPSRNVVTVNTPTKAQLASPPPTGNQKYIFWMILQRALQGKPAGLQTVDAASKCRTGSTCRLNGQGTVESPEKVMQDVLDVMLTYADDNGQIIPDIEIWTQDAQNEPFYGMISAATLEMGGTPRL